jgi:hemoglobin
MVVEYIRYSIDEPRADAFEHAYSEASTILESAPECLGYEISRCEEEPSAFTVRIEWRSVKEHVEGFRRSPGFGRFLELVRPFFSDIQEMRHYQPLVSGSAG